MFCKANCSQCPYFEQCTTDDNFDYDTTKPISDDEAI